MQKYADRLTPLERFKKYCSRNDSGRARTGRKAGIPRIIAVSERAAAGNGVPALRKNGYSFCETALVLAGALLLTASSVPAQVLSPVV